MSQVQAIVIPRRLAHPRDYLSPIARALRAFASCLPSITTKKNAYFKQAEVFTILADAQKDLVISRAYYEAAQVLRQLAEE